MHCTAKTLLTGAFAPSTLRHSSLPPSFLLPSFGGRQRASISSSTARQARRDGNRARGVSALHRTGLNRTQTLSVRLENLPKPVLDPARRSPVQVNEEHGLWEFFHPSRSSMWTPEELSSHGEGWSAWMLRQKDWADLHRLWWVCIKEDNRLLTTQAENQRIGGMYGDYEVDRRREMVSKTKRAIRLVLTERWYTWENARNVAMEDEEVNLLADPEKGEPAYLPKPRD